MIEYLISRFDFQLLYLRSLVVSIPDDRMADQPAPGINHPAWLLGHLAWAADLVPALAGGSPSLDADWAGRFGNRAIPVADRSLYPPKRHLLRVLKDAHDRAKQAVSGLEASRLGAEMPDPAYREIMPTVGDGIAHLLTTHEANHAGQMSAWRRVAGLGPIEFLSFV